MIPELAGNPFLPRIFEMWVPGARALDRQRPGGQRRGRMRVGSAAARGRPPASARLPATCVTIPSCPPSRFDADGDGYMHAGDLRALLESLGRLARDAEERYQCEWGLAGGSSKRLIGCWFR